MCHHIATLTVHTSLFSESQILNCFSNACSVHPLTSLGYQKLQTWDRVYLAYYIVAQLINKFPWSVIFKIKNHQHTAFSLQLYETLKLLQTKTNMFRCIYAIFRDIIIWETIKLTSILINLRILKSIVASIKPCSLTISCIHCCCRYSI